MAIIWYNGWNMGAQAGEFTTETAAIGLGFPYNARWDNSDTSQDVISDANPMWVYFNLAVQNYIPGERVVIFQWLNAAGGELRQFSLLQQNNGDFEARIETATGTAILTLSIAASFPISAGQQFLFVLYIKRDTGSQAEYQIDMYGKSPIQEYPAATLDSMVARASGTGARLTTAFGGIRLKTEVQAGKGGLNKLDWSCSDVVVTDAPLQAPGGLIGGWAAGGSVHVGPRILTVLPTGDVTTNWAKGSGGAGSFSEWDDVSPPNDATDYNQDNAVNEVQVSSCQDASVIQDQTPWDSVAGPTAGIKDIHKVIAVGLRPRYLQGGASPALFKPRMQMTGQTPVDGSALTPLNFWKSFGYFMFTETLPTVGGDWEHDKINALEVGAIISTAGASTAQVTALSVTALCDKWRQHPPGVM